MKDELVFPLIWLALGIGVFLWFIRGPKQTDIVVAENLRLSHQNKQYNEKLIKLEESVEGFRTSLVQLQDTQNQTNEALSKSVKLLDVQTHGLKTDCDHIKNKMKELGSIVHETTQKTANALSHAEDKYARCEDSLSKAELDIKKLKANQMVLNNRQKSPMVPQRIEVEIIDPKKRKSGVRNIVNSMTDAKDLL